MDPNERQETPTTETDNSTPQTSRNDKPPVIGTPARYIIAVLVAIAVFFLCTTAIACHRATRTDYPMQKTKIVKAAATVPDADDDTVLTDNTVTVQAESKADATPDTASFDIDITAESAMSDRATKKLNGMVSEVQDIIKKSRVGKKNYSTDSLNIEPSYNYRSDDDDIEGYRATTTISVNNIPIKKAEKIYSEVGKLAGSSDSDDTISLGYLKTTCSDYDKVYNKALEKAVKRAREKADAIAEAAGLEVKFAKTVTEGYESDNGYNAYTDDGYSVSTNDAVALPSKDSENVSISEGTKKISAEITATFVIG